jgi:hypothetical protein
MRALIVGDNEEPECRRQFSFLAIPVDLGNQSRNRQVLIDGNLSECIPKLIFEAHARPVTCNLY